MTSNKFLKILIVIFIFIFGIVYFFSEGKEEKNIKIGFIGSLSGKYSVLGNAMMNGVYLAIEEENYKINDRKIELLLRDDKHNKKLNKKYINEFIENDVKIVIGNVTSLMSKDSMSIINKHDDMIMISALSASNSFTSIDDRFFRVHVANDAKRFDGFTKSIIRRGHKKVYGIYDPFNITYSKDFLENFEKSFINNGGDKFLAYNKTNINLDNLINDIEKLKPDLVLICANSVDTARVVQYLRMKKINTKVASSEWAMTNEFIQNGGKSVEGVLFNIDFDSNSLNKEFVSFSNKFKEKHKMEPSMFAAKAYELTKIIIDSLKNVHETQIKEQILSKRIYQGLHDEIIFDEFGDVKRNFYDFIIIDGNYKRVDN